MDWSTHILSRLQQESHIGFVLEWGYLKIVIFMEKIMVNPAVLGYSLFREIDVKTETCWNSDPDFGP